MNKVISIIVAILVVIISFIAGVKYSDGVKNHAGWLFESKEDEVELPQLEDEEVSEDPAAYDQQMINSESESMDPAQNSATDANSGDTDSQESTMQPAQTNNQAGNKVAEENKPTNKKN
jgi:hypothetical protein